MDWALAMLGLAHTEIELVEFLVVFAAAQWSLLFLMPLKAAHYGADGALVVRRIFLGNVLAKLVVDRVRRSGANLVMDVEGQPAIIGGPLASAALVGLLVVPWVE